METTFVHRRWWLVVLLAIPVLFQTLLLPKRVYAAAPADGYTPPAPLLATVGTISGGGYVVDSGFWYAAPDVAEINTLDNGEQFVSQRSSTYGEDTIAKLLIGQIVFFIFVAVFVYRRWG